MIWMSSSPTGSHLKFRLVRAMFVGSSPTWWLRFFSLNPNSVYVGVSGTDSQVEIFDPNSGLALIAARTLKLLQKIS